LKIAHKTHWQTHTLTHVGLNAMQAVYMMNTKLQ